MLLHECGIDPNTCLLFDTAVAGVVCALKEVPASQKIVRCLARCSELKSSQVCFTRVEAASRRRGYALHTYGVRLVRCMWEASLCGRARCCLLCTKLCDVLCSAYASEWVEWTFAILQS